MSASPSGPPSGPPSVPPSTSRTPTPNAGGQPQFIRRRKPAADPLRQNRRPVQRPPPVAKSAVPRPNGLTAVKAARPHALNGAAPLSSTAGYAASNGVNPARAITDFSETPKGPYKDFPLYTTKKALREGLRYHIARFSGKKEVNPADQEDFIRPVSLHRRDPRQPPPGKALKVDELAEPLDDKEKEKEEIARQEREAKRAADLAQIAPTGNNPAATAAKRASGRQEKTTQIFRNDRTEDQKKESELRYEEALPWHLEDAENKHTWVGNYEAALSDTNVIFVIDGNSFKMVPIEKWYKFNPKNQFKTMTIEEAEAEMAKKSRLTRWALRDEEQVKAEKENQGTRMNTLYTVKGESNTYRRTAKTETMDADELDFEGDLFADDDEMPSFEPDRDEDSKFAQEKIKREQLGANLFGEGDEAEVERELEEERKEREARRTLGKSMKKKLQKRERNYLYDSDSSHPYSSSSSDVDTSDDEKIKEEDRRKDEEAKLKAKTTSKLPSGASSKGSTTPSGRPSKHGDLSRANHLKRPGSPNLSASETSGNESSRKKHKRKHGMSPTHPGPTSSSQPPSRPMSPQPSLTGQSPRKSSIIKLNVNSSKVSDIQSAPPNPSGAMSDGEATGGEMSDGAGGKKKIKLRLGASLSPSASRAGSPAAGSRAGSPALQAASRQQSPDIGSPPLQEITAPEIIAAIPPAGISIGALLKLFSGRIKGGGKEKADREKFIALVKENSRYSPEDKLLRPKT